MKDKICIVTGGSSGVGKATVKGLAGSGAKVIIVSRNEIKAKKVIQDISRETGNNNLHWMYSDLSNQESIRNFVSDFRKRFNYLNILANNAGIIHLKREETVDGIEKTLAVDYLSHFMLSNLLLDLLKKGSPSRIITVAGNPGLIRLVRIDFEDIQMRKGYNGIKAAIQAAHARVIFSMELAKRLAGTGITSNTFQPGLVRTGMGNYQPSLIRFAAGLVQPLLSEECKTAVYLTTSDEVENLTGKFFKKSKPVKFSYTNETGARLWKLSENLTGINFQPKYNL